MHEKGMTTVGILHPGAMGSSVGAAVKCGIAHVFWASENRSEATHERARSAELDDAGSVRELVGRCELIISVCPPGFAREVAASAAGYGFSGIYLDANAISPEHSREVARIVEAAGARYVDGGIVGGPAWKPGTTRLYMAGSHARQTATVFDGSPLETIVLKGPVGSASALKMAYAAYTKGTTSLLGGILALCEHEGVGEALMAEWSRSQPELAARAAERVRRTTAKAWRFVAEMEEIADTFEEAGLPGGFHRAAAQIYHRQAGYKDAADPPALGDVVAALLCKQEP